MVPARHRNDKCLEGFTGGYLQSEVEHVFLHQPGTPAHATTWPPPQRITVLRPAEGLAPPAGAQPGGEWSPRADLVELEAEQVRALSCPLRVAAFSASLHHPSQRCTFLLRGAPSFSEVHLPSQRCTFPRHAASRCMRSLPNTLQSRSCTLVIQCFCGRARVSRPGGLGCVCCVCVESDKRHPSPHVSTLPLPTSAPTPTWNTSARQHPHPHLNVYTVLLHRFGDTVGDGAVEPQKNRHQMRGR